jgi:hypothetical protein
MKRLVRFTEPARKDGKISAEARVVLFDVPGGWRGHYRFSTRGMTPDQAAANLAHLEAHFAKKAEHLNRFRTIQRVEFVVGTDAYRITDVTIIDIGEGGGEVELYVQVKRIDQTGALVKVDGFPWRRRFASIDAVPANAGSVEEIKPRVVDVSGMQAKHNSYVQQVESLVGGGEGV